MRSLLSLSLLAIALFTGSVLAEPHAHRRNHDSLARRAKGDLNIHKRFDSARWTFYDVGMGACGQNNVPSDFIVALNSAQFGGGYPGRYCFKSITMTYGGKTATATIMDECPGCPMNGLDLSTGLFSYFASQDLGVIYGTWSFNDGSGGGGGGGGGNPTTSPTSKWTPPTSQWEPPTTTTWQPPTTSKWEPSTTSTWQPPSSSWSPPPSSSSSSSSSSTSSSSSVNSINFSIGAASGLAVPSGIVPGNSDQPGSQSQGILNLNEALVCIAGIIVAGAEL